MGKATSQDNVSLYSTIDDVPAADWEGLRTGPADLAMDRRLLKAFESTMAPQCRCWYALVRDGDACVAAACLCRFAVDALETTGPAAQKITRYVRRVWPGFMRFGVLFCGLPVPSGSSHLRLAPQADVAAVIAALDLAMTRLARQTRSRLIVFKEFDKPGLEPIQPALQRIGYIRGDVPCTYELNGHFADGQAYLDALRSRYRRQIHESAAAGERHGARATVHRGQEAARVFDDRLHALYRAVRDRAQYRMETLSLDFFRSAAHAFGSDASLVTMQIDQTVCGFLFGLTAGGEYHNLYVGLDYDKAKKAEVYFNLYTLDLDRAYREGAHRIHLGQTSDDFKARLGAEGKPLWFFVRATNPVIHAGLRRCARIAFPAVQRPIHHDVFRAPASGGRSAAPARRPAHVSRA